MMREPVIRIPQSAPVPAALRNGYLLIDPCNLDASRLSETLPMVRCTPLSLVNSDELMPRLIDVAALTPSQQDSLMPLLFDELRGEQPPMVCAWIESDGGLDTLRGHIAHMLVGPDVHGQEALWRFHDPRVFALVLTLFRPAQLHALLRPVSTWQFGWCGHWWRVTGAKQEEPTATVKSAAWPDALQWESLAHCAALTAVMGRLQDDQGACAPQETLHRLRRSNALMLSATARFSLVEPDELIAYTLLHMRYGSSIAEHPKLASGWPALSQGSVRWADMISVLNADDYADLQAKALLSDQLAGAS